MRGASRGDPEVEQRAVRRRRYGVRAVRAGPGFCRSGGAAPAGRPRKPAPGRSGVAVRPHYGGLPSVAGRGGKKGGESCPDRRARTPLPATEERPLEQKSPQVERRVASAPIARRADAARRRTENSASRRSIPSCFGGARKTANPAPPKTGAMTLALAR